MPTRCQLLPRRFARCTGLLSHILTVLRAPRHGEAHARFSPALHVRYVATGKYTWLHVRNDLPTPPARRSCSTYPCLPIEAVCRVAAFLRLRASFRGLS